MSGGYRLPPWRSVLAAVTHPDDESLGLGAILSAFADHGAELAVLCFTHGEASTTQGLGKVPECLVGASRSSGRSQPCWRSCRESH
jgi:LmbE family N-acetylglucosaminyl deacetylase